MTQVGHRFCKDVCITLTAIWLLSTSGCRQGTDVSSSTPPQADSSVAVSSPALPELPENKMLVTSPGEGDFLIAENGTAKAVIVIPEEPSDKVRAAARTFRRIWKRSRARVWRSRTTRRIFPERTASWSGRPNRRRRWESNSRPVTRIRNG